MSSTTGGGMEKDGAERMPVLFIGHGNPMNAITSNSFTRNLRQLGEDLTRPKAILVVSAHWLTRGTYVTCAQWPKTIHDFHGFPKELFEVSYPALGSPQMARQIVEGADGGIKCDNGWGLDHASWSILKHIYPEADVPVMELSLDYQFGEWNPKPLSYHYALAARLKSLRSEGVLIIGSGNLVHNLRMVDYDEGAAPYSWAVEFDEALKARLLANEHEALLDYHRLGENATYSIPTLDHYLPMIYAIGLQEDGEKLEFVHEGIQNASVSMRSFRIG